jgi:hypothetical protein
VMKAAMAFSSFATKIFPLILPPSALQHVYGNIDYGRSQYLRIVVCVLRGALFLIGRRYEGAG